MRQGRRQPAIAIARLALALGFCAASAPLRAQTSAPADAAKLSAWSTGGASATAKPTDPDGKPAPTAGGGVMPYWQAPALPGAVIQGGTIPPGWQPQAIPYQGIGPDGRVITQYYAPTYTFTYQVGPPVLAMPQPTAVNRRQAPGYYRSPQPYGVAPTPYAPGWNYQTQGAPPVNAALPPTTVARYAPQPQSFAPPPAAPSAWTTMPQQTTTPPSQWAASSEAQPQGFSGTPSSPATTWAAAVPAAVAAGGAAAASPPTTAITPTAPQQSPAVQPLGSSPPTVPVAPRAANAHLWRVVGVQDGDTVTCLDEANQEQKIHLAGIDAPELGQDYGKNAREALAGMVFGRTVEVVDAGRDRDGSVIGQLAVDGLDVNRQMVATGNAWCAASSQDQSLADAQSQGRAAALGLWSQPNPTPPWQYRASGQTP